MQVLSRAVLTGKSNLATPVRTSVVSHCLGKEDEPWMQPVESAADSLTA